MEVQERHARTRTVTRDTVLPANKNEAFRNKKMRREVSRVSFLMCPFRVRVVLPQRTTDAA